MALRAPTLPASLTPDPVAPASPALQSVLRRAVLEHVSTERRRVYPAVLHLGTPGARRVALTQHLPRLDHALRTDIVEALFRHFQARADDDVPEPPEQPLPPVLLWLTRSGALDAEDDDLAWSSAARCAGGELGTTLPMVVVTRQGWCDPATGAGRSWRRLRPPVRP